MNERNLEIFDELSMPFDVDKGQRYTLNHIKIISLLVRSLGKKLLEKYSNKMQNSLVDSSNGTSLSY